MNAARVPLSSGSLAVVFTLTCMLAWVAVVAWLPEPRLLRLVPDDAFYYLRIAEHRARAGAWTFDGTEPTTGFHLLHGFLLASVVSVVDRVGWGELVGTTGLVRIVSALGVLVAGLGALVAHGLLRPLWGRRADLALVLFAAGAYSGVAAFNALESGEVLAATAIALALFVRILSRASPDRAEIEAPPARERLAFLALMAALPLVRTDLIFLSGALVCAGLAATMPAPAGHPGARSVRATLWMGGLSTGLGLAALTLFCVRVTGQLSQDSGRIKRVWQSLASLEPGERIRDAGRILADVARVPFDPGAFGVRDLNASAFALIVPIAAIGVCAARERRAFPSPVRRAAGPGAAVLLAATLQIVMFAAYYGGLASGVQPRWYFSSLLWGILLSLATLLASTTRPWGAATRGVALFLVAAGLLSGGITTARGYWPNQLRFLDSARWLAAQPDERTAAWNAGILSYYSRREVVNLDGVVNSGIADYARRRAVVQYLLDRGVERVVDAREMLKYPYVAATMDVGEFERRFVPVRELDSFIVVWKRAP